MLVTHQSKQNGNGFAITAGFAEINNWVEEETAFSVSSTEEIGPPVDPSVTAPVIYGSQSTTFGSRTVILGSTNAPGTYTLPANIGYLLNPTTMRRYTLQAAGGETVDLGELRNRTNGTQSIRVYGSLTPYKLQYVRFTRSIGDGTKPIPSYPDPFHFESLFVVPVVGNIIPLDATAFQGRKTPFRDNWGGDGFIFDYSYTDSVVVQGDVRLPNNSYPNCADYVFDGSVNGSNGVRVSTESTNAILLSVDRSNISNDKQVVCISTGEFKVTGLSSTSFADENFAITSFNSTYGTTKSPINGSATPYRCAFRFLGGQLASLNIS